MVALTQSVSVPLVVVLVVETGLSIHQVLEVEDDANMVLVEGMADILDNEDGEDRLDSLVEDEVDAMNLDVELLKMLSDSLVAVAVAAMSLDVERVETLEEDPWVAYCVVVEEVARLQVAVAWLQMAVARLQVAAEGQVLKENSRACPKEHVCATSCQAQAPSFQLRLACVSPLVFLELVAVQVDPGCQWEPQVGQTCHSH